MQNRDRGNFEEVFRNVLKNDEKAIRSAVQPLELTQEGVTEQLKAQITTKCESYPDFKQFRADLEKTRQRYESASATEMHT